MSKPARDDFVKKTIDPAPVPVAAESLATREADRLAGQILVAMPSLTEPTFAQTVILVCAHGADGAMGLVLNRPVLSLSFAELLRQLEIAPDPPRRDLRLCAGGPVETGRGFVLHSTDWMGESSLAVAEAFGLTTSLDILKAIAEGTGPREGLLALGYAGWGPGQLEAELVENAWLSLPADQTLVFDGANETRWQRAMAKMHINPAALSPDAGHA